MNGVRPATSLLKRHSNDKTHMTETGNKSSVGWLASLIVFSLSLWTEMLTWAQASIHKQKTTTTKILSAV